MRTLSDDTNEKLLCSEYQGCLHQQAEQLFDVHSSYPVKAATNVRPHAGLLGQGCREQTPNARGAPEAEGHAGSPNLQREGCAEVRLRLRHHVMPRPHSFVV